MPHNLPAMKLESNEEKRRKKESGRREDSTEENRRKEEQGKNKKVLTMKRRQPLQYIKLMEVSLAGLTRFYVFGS